MKEIRENLGNLEGVICTLENQNNLINILIDDYFGRNKVDLKDGWELAWEYKRYQALIFTISDALINVEKTLKENVYAIYDELKEGVENGK